MYSWLWQKLPFSPPVKIICSLLLVVGIVALLWYVAFPAIDPLLPFNDGQITE